MSDRNAYRLTPELLLRAYAAGIFPMAESAASREIRWYDPPVRGLIPLDARFHIPRRLARTLRQVPFRVTFDTAFERVMRECAAPDEGRETTWINAEIIRLYTRLHGHGFTHSIEVWDGEDLVGGLYGVALRGAFFGESMFSRQTDASKIALTHLVALLRHCSFVLLDTQFQTPHLARFGAYETTRANYHHMLEEALTIKPTPFPAAPDWVQLLAAALSEQPVTQIS